jgi:hypothetical protein
MDSQSDNQKRKPLVTVEFQTEVDVATGNREKRMFVKMYFEARDSGLLAAIPDRDWKTLCCLATYMDEHGNCYPSQALMAKYLGIARETVNRRIQGLLNFRFQGEPVVTMTKNRKKTADGGRWANNVYQLKTIAGLGIFDEHQPKSSENTAPKAYVTETSHRPMSANRHIGERHTNQIQELTRSFNVNDFSKFSRKAEQTSTTSDDEIKTTGVMLEILEVCGDPHSRAFYRLIAQRAPADMVFAALSETKHQARMGHIRKSRGAFFTDEIQRLAQERGIDLGLNLPKSVEKARPN